MTQWRSMREADRLAGDETRERPPLDLAAAVGTWTNTDPESGGIVRVDLASRDGRLVVRAYGAARPEPLDWGEVTAEVLLSDGLAGRRLAAFTARYDFGYLESHLQGNLNLGLLVLASFNSWRDRSGRSSTFSREFYHR